MALEAPLLFKGVDPTMKRAGAEPVQELVTTSQPL